jgi:asparagine synthase (glutamine-hydrolysing)
MNHTNCLGGIWRRSRGGPPPGSVREQWGWVGAHAELFARGSACSRLYTWDGLALLIRGYARPDDCRLPLDLGCVAQEIRRYYIATGELHVDGLEGSFTLALLDSRAERVILYRNLIGTGSTYYRATDDGLLFAANLSELLAVSKLEPRPNRSILPDYFLFRCVPGRETLFEGPCRLLPGEEVTWDCQAGLTRRQRHTFADLSSPTISPTEAIERTDAVMADILRDQSSYRGEPANLLSGGVDSSYIQAIYNQEVYTGERLPPSYSLSVDHPMTWIDTDYAITASQAIGTRHMLAPADGPYREYLLDALATSAEPLNHVQSAYFGHLARKMADDGVRVGFCGEGADSLFGLGLANKLHNARVIERLLPLPFLRPLAANVCALFGWDALAATVRLAGRREDDSALTHPINSAAVFTDLTGAVECFGRDEVEAAFARRRALLDLYDVPDDPMHRLHAVGFLGEAIDSAGLWATLFERQGVSLLCPFLDSRMLRLSFSLHYESRFRFRRPKDVLKRALALRAPAELATRVKLGFGQPVFEWLAPGGQLAPLVERVAYHGIVPAALFRQLQQKPTWLLYSLVCYDQWHRLFVERSVPMPQGPTPSRRPVRLGEQPATQPMPAVSC